MYSSERRRALINFSGGGKLNSQYKKGVIELCVLSLLSTRDCYGYDVSEYLSQRIKISDGTVYPILRKLKNDGLVTTYLQESAGGPARKYYKLTDTGRCQFLNDRDEWKGFVDSVMTILEENENEKN